MAKQTGLLIKVRGDGQAMANALQGFGEGEVETILTVPARVAGQGIDARPGSKWLRVNRVEADANPWDQVHALVSGDHAFLAAANAQVEAVEPDLEQQWPYAREPSEKPVAVSEAEFCAFDAQNPK